MPNLYARYFKVQWKSREPKLFGYPSMFFKITSLCSAEEKKSYSHTFFFLFIIIRYHSFLLGVILRFV